MISETVPHFERHNLFTRILRIATVPLLNHIPSNLLKRLMKATSQDAATVVDSGGSTHALEAMYTRYHRRPFAHGFIPGKSKVPNPFPPFPSVVFSAADVDKIKAASNEFDAARNSFS